MILILKDIIGEKAWLRVSFNNIGGKMKIIKTISFFFNLFLIDGIRPFIHSKNESAP